MAAMTMPDRAPGEGVIAMHPGARLAMAARHVELRHAAAAATDAGGFGAAARSTLNHAA